MRACTRVQRRREQISSVSWSYDIVLNEAWPDRPRIRSKSSGEHPIFTNDSTCIVISFSLFTFFLFLVPSLKVNQSLAASVSVTFIDLYDYRECWFRWCPCSSLSIINWKQNSPNRYETDYMLHARQMWFHSILRFICQSFYFYFIESAVIISLISYHREWDKIFILWLFSQFSQILFNWFAGKLLLKFKELQTNESNYESLNAADDSLNSTLVERYKIYKTRGERKLRCARRQVAIH